MSNVFRKVISTTLVIILQATVEVNAVYKTVNVTLISQQPYENACWAATGASICRFKGKSVTKEQFATKAGMSINERQGIDVVQSTLKSYGSSSTYKSGFATYAIVKSSIDTGKTMCVNVGHHAVALRGYREELIEGTNYAFTYFMDPSQGSYIFIEHGDLLIEDL